MQYAPYCASSVKCCFALCGTQSLTDSSEVCVGLCPAAVFIWCSFPILMSCRATLWLARYIHIIIIDSNKCLCNDADSTVQCVIFLNHSHTVVFSILLSSVAVLWGCLFESHVLMHLDINICGGIYHTGRLMNHSLLLDIHRKVLNSLFFFYTVPA